MITNTGNVNSLINSYLNTNKNDINTNKSANQIKYSEDSYVPSTKFATSLGVYSKEVEKDENVEEVEEVEQKRVSFEEEYEEYCVLFYQGTTSGHLIPIYYPPPNAPYAVKSAWIETMKSLTSNEQNTAKYSILLAVQAAIGKPDHEITGEMYQNYLINKYASYEALENLFLENFINSKERECDKFMESVLNTFKTNYEKYSEK